MHLSVWIRGVTATHSGTPTCIAPWRLEELFTEILILKKNSGRGKTVEESHLALSRTHSHFQRTNVSLAIWFCCLSSPSAIINSRKPPTIYQTHHKWQAGCTSSLLPLVLAKGCNCPQPFLAAGFPLLLQFKCTRWSPAEIIFNIKL